MVMKKVLGAVIAVTIAMIFLAPVTGAVADNTGTANVTDENVTVSTTEYTDLGGYDLLDGSVTVEDTSGTSATEGTDYELATDNGSIKAVDGGLFSDGDTAVVSYEYQASGGLTSTVVQFVPTMLGLFAFVAVARMVQQEM